MTDQLDEINPWSALYYWIKDDPRPAIVIYFFIITVDTIEIVYDTSFATLLTSFGYPFAFALTVMTIVFGFQTAEIKAIKTRILLSICTKSFILFFSATILFLLAIVAVAMFKGLLPPYLFAATLELAAILSFALVFSLIGTWVPARTVGKRTKLHHAFSRGLDGFSWTFSRLLYGPAALIIASMLPTMIVNLLANGGVEQSVATQIFRSCVEHIFYTAAIIQAAIILTVAFQRGVDASAAEFQMG